MTALLDTDVLIDCLRGVEAATDWLAASPDQRFEVPGIVAMELVAGCRNQRELKQIQQFIQNFSVAWPDSSEFQHAYGIYTAHRLSTGLSIPDSIIAAMVLVRSATLYTFNLRHFQNIPGLNAQAPYQRP